METTQADGTTLSYQYDLTGNRTQVQVTRNGQITSLTDYTYDHYHRLATVTDTQGTTAYGYDPVGNLSTVRYPVMTQ